MKTLDKASIEELELELKKRSEKKPIQKEFELYMGLIDVDGAESLIKVIDHKHFNSLWSSLTLRARFNSQRSALVYIVHLTDKLFDNYNKQLAEGKFIETAKSLMKLSTFKKIF